MMKRIVFSTAFLVFATCGVAQADLRVVHASPDAPAVDVIVEDGFGMPAISNLAFTEITPYLTLPQLNYNFKVVPAGLSEPVVIDANVFVNDDRDYTVIASDVLASITPLVFVDDNRVAEDAARVRFIHLSPNAPAVDIALADGGPVLFGGVEFQQSGGYIEVPGGTYDLEARLAGTETVVLSIPGVMLENGMVYTAYAMGLVGDMETPLQAVLSVDAVDPKVRVAHASPDAPPVDVIVNDDFAMPAVEDLAFTGVTGYLSVPPADYNFKVVPAGLTEPVVIDADATLPSNFDITIAACGLLGDLSIAPCVYVDDNTLNEDVARIRFIHLSPNAPAVDIRVTGTEIYLFENVAFTESGGYVEVPGGTYDLEVLAAGTELVALEVEGLTVTPYTVYTVYAMGLLNLSAGDETALQAVVSLDAQDFRKGDLNCDGFIHLKDINPFVLALTSTEQFKERHPGCDPNLADINGDGALNLRDVNPFIELMMP